MEDTHSQLMMTMMTIQHEFVGQYDNIGWRNDGSVQYGELHMNELHYTKVSNVQVQSEKLK